MFKSLLEQFPDVLKDHGIQPAKGFELKRFRKYWAHRRKWEHRSKYLLPHQGLRERLRRVKERGRLAGVLSADGRFRLVPSKDASTVRVFNDEGFITRMRAEEMMK